MPESVSIKEAENRIADLLERVIGGREEILITDEGKPIARLSPVEDRPKCRVPGGLMGKLVISPDFDDPLPEEILSSFE